MKIYIWFGIAVFTSVKLQQFHCGIWGRGKMGFIPNNVALNSSLSDSQSNSQTRENLPEWPVSPIGPQSVNFQPTGRESVPEGRNSKIQSVNLQPAGREVPEDRNSKIQSVNFQPTVREVPEGWNSKIQSVNFHFYK